MTVGNGIGMGIILLLIIFVVVLVLVVPGLAPGIRSRINLSGDADAFEILKRRYARGEIDKTEYETLRRNLSD
jgi:putative membrane protein